MDDPSSLPGFLGKSLTAPHEIVIDPGAGHLFGEAGALARPAGRASRRFDRHSAFGEVLMG